MNSLTALAGVGLDADVLLPVLLCSPLTPIPSSMSSAMSILRLCVHRKSHGFESISLLLSVYGMSGTLYAALTGGDGNEKRGGLIDGFVSVGVWRPGTVKSIGDCNVSGRSCSRISSIYGFVSVSVVIISVFGMIRSAIMVAGMAIDDDDDVGGNGGGGGAVIYDG